jgi:hypothetical protein
MRDAREGRGLARGADLASQAPFLHVAVQAAGPDRLAPVIR